MFQFHLYSIHSSVFIFTEFSFQILSCLCYFVQRYVCIFLVFNQEFISFLDKPIEVFAHVRFVLLEFFVGVYDYSSKLCPVVLLFIQVSLIG